jgi:hypothetical protein
MDADFQNSAATPEDVSDRTYTTWDGDAGEIRVDFGPLGAYEAEFRECRRIQQTSLDNFLWRLNRQWHRWFPE